MAAEPRRAQRNFILLVLFCGQKVSGTVTNTTRPEQGTARPDHGRIPGAGAGISASFVPQLCGSQRHPRLADPGLQKSCTQSAIPLHRSDRGGP